MGSEANDDNLTPPTHQLMICL